MARFIGYVQGNRKVASRLGTPVSGIRTTANGWNVGVRVNGGVQLGEDVFYVYATGGSRGGGDRCIAVVSLDKSGKVISETSAEHDARVDREVKQEAAKAAKPESFEVSPGRVNRGGCY